MRSPVTRAPTSVDTMFRVMDAADVLRQEARGPQGDDDGPISLALDTRSLGGLED